jgi:hypothetical protein
MTFNWQETKRQASRSSSINQATSNKQAINIIKQARARTRARVSQCEAAELRA